MVLSKPIGVFVLFRKRKRKGKKRKEKKRKGNYSKLRIGIALGSILTVLEGSRAEQSRAEQSTYT